MKTLLAVGWIFLVAGMVHADFKEEIMEIVKDHLEPCAQEHNILPTEMDKFYSIDLLDEDRTRFGCLKACIMKRMSTMKDGHIDAEEFKHMLEKQYENKPEKIATELEVSNKCIDEVKEIIDECDIAFEFTRCLLKHYMD